MSRQDLRKHSAAAGLGKLPTKERWELDANAREEFLNNATFSSEFGAMRVMSAAETPTDNGRWAPTRG